MKKHEIIKEFDKDVFLFGQLVPARVVIGAAIDDGFELDWDFESEEEKEKLTRQIERGYLTPMVILVEVSAFGLTGSDALGGVLVEIEKDALDAVEQNSMVDQATAALADEIRATIEQGKTLQKLFEKETA
jgi:hypothetical protein